MLSNKKNLTVSDFINARTLNRVMLVVILLAEIIVFSSLTPYFFKFKNMLSVGREIATLGLVAIGQTMCILLGGFDLSVGGAAALCGIVSAYFASESFLGLPYGVALAAAMLCAALIGVGNGFLISKIKVNPFITTMSMNFILGGAVILISKNPITVNSPAYKFLGDTTLGELGGRGIPLPLIIMALLFAIFAFILKYTKLGRRIYATGGNIEAARIAGINVERIQFSTYLMSSLLSGFAGIMLASRLATANPNIGSSYGMESIAAAVLGGTALSGGEGNVWGSFMGVVVMGLLSNGLVMVGVSQAWRNIATGIVLVFAIVLQLLSKKSKKH